VSDLRGNQRGERRRYRIAGAASPVSPFGVVGSPHVDDLAAAYALGALDAEELALVDSHVRGCVACERAVGEASRTVAMLPFLLPQQAPPADAKIALFSRVAHAQRAAAASSLPLPAASIESVRTPTLPRSSDFAFDTRAPAPPVAAPTARSSRSGWLATVLSLPLLVALIATGMWGVQLRDQLALRNAELSEMQAELTNFGSGTTSFPLQPGGAAPQAEGSIILGSDQLAGMVKIDVNAKDGPKTFDVWAVEDGRMQRVGEVTVNQEGQGLGKFELPQPFGEYESVHVKARAADSEGGVETDTLMRDNNGSLGSTGSGLELVP
jgi:hypothetical protein